MLLAPRNLEGAAPSAPCSPPYAAPTERRPPMIDRTASFAPPWAPGNRLAARRHALPAGNASVAAAQHRSRRWSGGKWMPYLAAVGTRLEGCGSENLLGPAGSRPAERNRHEQEAVAVGDRPGQFLDSQRVCPLPVRLRWVRRSGHGERRDHRVLGRPDDRA